MKKIYLSGKYGNGKFALVDDEDYENLNKLKWYAKISGDNIYALNMRRRMHRLVLNVKANEIVDHIDRNGLNNQKSNLRLCTRSQNAANSKVKNTNIVGLKGVETHSSRKNTWLVRIRVNGKRIYLGCFHNPVEAALAYNKAAQKYFGEFALLNKI